MGRQMVEQGRVKSHLRVLRFYSKVILGPSFLFVLVNARLQFYPAPNSGTVSFFPIVLMIRFRPDCPPSYAWVTIQFFSHSLDDTI
jgi:hypothetical protein